MPDRMRSAAWLTASSPDAQKRLSCTPATVSGRPAAMAEILAMSPPWSPIGETTPSTMSSMVDGSSSGKRWRISSIRPTTREMGLVSCREPEALPRPRGVRIAS